MSDQADRARVIALNRLTAAPRTRAQLHASMAAGGVADSVADEVLDRLTAVGLVDDEAFAEEWARSRRRSRGLSRQAIERELRERGVAEDILGQVVAPFDASDDLETARELVRDRLRRRPEVGPDDLRRLAGYLARRGHSSDVAWAAIRSEIDADLAGADDDMAAGDDT